MPLIDQPLSLVLPDSAPIALLPVIVRNPHNGFEYTAYGQIDTGADESTIPESVAKKLGHDIYNEKVERSDVCGVGGHTTIYLHTFEIDVCGQSELGAPNFADPFYTISPRRLGVVTDLHRILLGVRDFLIFHKLVINYPQNTFSLY